MKNRILITTLVTLVTTTSIHAADSGSIDLTLDIGNSSAEQTLTAEANLDDGGEGTTLVATESGGVRTLEDSIGTMSFTGENVDTDLTCVVMFTGSNQIIGNKYQLVDTNDSSNSIGYYLRVRRDINGATNSNQFTVNAGTTETNTALQAQSIANGTGSNSCSIEITELVIKSDDNLTNKNGNFTDTLTYTMTAI